ncbi:hypothetical protein PHYBOEH_010111 [Phytophthora boehmeriae]|uniref:Uncharacterized protein n=1 Tax=Phytophthora boehmeriae TaxID=109152 RepID=A0A8T1X4B9_9STRA|nr:hypothetical protein PHYBOEH_010111 [Phytophthora boehmeriae]
MCNAVMLKCPPPFVDPAVVSTVSKALMPLPAAGQPIQLPTLSTQLELQLSGACFRSEPFRLRTQNKLTELERTATSLESCDTNALLAKKTLKYRLALEQRALAAQR